MNISLTPKLETMVKKKVESGMYNSASEVIREALRLLEEKDNLYQMRLKALKQNIQDGINSGESSSLDIENIKAEARKQREQVK